MERRVITLDKTMSLSPGNDTSVDLPLTGVIKSINIEVTGAYAIGTGVLDSQAAQKIFRQIQVKANGDKVIYSPKGIDQHKLQYYKNRGSVKFTAAAGTFHSYFKLNTGLIFANEKLLPDNYENLSVKHPSLPIKSLTLITTWATAADFFSTLGTATLDSATARITIEMLIMTKDEVVQIFGPSMERYALPKVSAAQFDNLAQNTELKDAGNIGTDTLVRRAILVALDNTGAQSDSIVSKYAIVKTKPENVSLITDFYITAQEDDIHEDQVSAPLPGCVDVDIAREVTGDGFGYRGEGTSDSLKITAQLGAAGSIRWITEEFILSPQARSRQVTPLLTL